MIRWLLRLFMLLLFLFGLGAGFVYPSLSLRQTAEIGSWTVFERATGFAPADVQIGAANVPFRASLRIRLERPPVLSAGGSILTLTAATEGRTVLAGTVDVVDLTTHLVNPQTGELEALAPVGGIEHGSASTYVFTAGPGDAETDKLLSVDLVLESAGSQLDSRLQPIGLVAMAIGFIGLVGSFRQSRRPANPNSQPPPPRWGRGAGK